MQFKNKEKFVMNGKSYFLDTNAIIQLLKGNQQLIDILQEADFITCSVISKLEFLSFPNLSDNDAKLFDDFIKKIEIMDLLFTDKALEQGIVTLRKDKKLKLPDAIIVASSIYKNCILITADKKILAMKELNSLPYQVI